MPQVSKRNNGKGIKRFFRSIKCSIAGLFYAYRYERSLWLHGGVSIFTIILGIILGIKPSEWAIIFIALGTILGVELLNTAIEANVDLVTLEENELARIAKDCGSAASFVMTLVAIIICLMVFNPYIVNFFK